MHSNTRRSARLPNSAFASFIALASIFVLSHAVDAQQSWESAFAAVAEQIESDVRADDAGGVVVGVSIDGDLVWADAFGLADRATGAPMTTSSIGRTGSISKSVTAFLMMILVDRGVIGLDEPVARYLPAVDGFADRRPHADPITFRHLASHTAGLVREPDWRGSVVGSIELWEKRILESIPLTAYDSVPGARYQYSNIGFGTLGLALSAAAGEPFMDLVRDEIFDPLGMTGSEFVVVGAELEPRLSQGYQRSRDGSVDGAQPAAEHAGRGYKVPNGGVYSTVADLARFLGATSGVPGLQLISEESRQEMLRIQTPEDPNAGYSLGYSVTIDDDGRRIVGHGGSVAGYNAAMSVDPEAGIGVVLLRNYTGGSTNLGRTAADLIRTLRELR